MLPVDWAVQTIKLQYLVLQGTSCLTSMPKTPNSVPSTSASRLVIQLVELEASSQVTALFLLVCVCMSLTSAETTWMKNCHFLSQLCDLLFSKSRKCKTNNQKQFNLIVVQFCEVNIYTAVSTWLFSALLLACALLVLSQIYYLGFQFCCETRRSLRSTN
jgi:hypothetical protein